jgi:hypothetical protein
MSTARDASHDRAGLWTLVAPPVVWAAHFLGSYITAAIWCAKLAGPAGSLGPARALILAYTVVAVVVVAILGWRGYRRHAHGDEGLPHDVDSAPSRRRFLGFATFLLSLLSAVAILYAATAVAFIEDCR